MTKTEQEVIEHILYTGEISKELLQKIIPNTNTRYTDIKRWKRDGIYRITRGKVTSYGLDIGKIDENRLEKLSRMIDENGIGVIKEKPETAGDRRERMWRGMYVLSMLYGSRIKYLPSAKPVYGEEFPYTTNYEKVNREEIEREAREGGVYYSAHEIKRERRGDGEVISDETLRRNRASGILFAGEKGYVVYSFPKMKSNRMMKWTKEHDYDMYMLVRTQIRGKTPDTIFVGSTLELAEEIMRCSEEAVARERPYYCLHLDNIAGEQVYYIPSGIAEPKIRGSGTRLLEYIANAEYRAKIDGMICRIEKCAEPEKEGYQLGVLSGQRYLYNLMDMNLNKLRHAMRMGRTRVYCFDWQEEFVKRQMERSGNDCEVITYEEPEIMKYM